MVAGWNLEPPGHPGAGLKPQLGPAPEGASHAVSSLTGPSREFTRDSSGLDRRCRVGAQHAAPLHLFGAGPSLPCRGAACCAPTSSDLASLHAPTRLHRPARAILGAHVV